MRGRLAACLILPLSGCVVATVVDTAVDVTATVVETTVDVGAAVVTAPIAAAEMAFGEENEPDPAAPVPVE